MLLELAKPIVLMACILCLFAVFHTAFLVPAATINERVCDSLALLALAAGLSLLGGIIFQQATPGTKTGGFGITATLPVQVFCWTSSILIILFLVSWYLETHCIFYRDVRRL